MIFARIETMDHVPRCCGDCDFEEIGGWCLMLPKEKQDSFGEMDPELLENAKYKGIDGQTYISLSECARRKDCPLKEMIQ